jgi:hypothetical protein
MIINPYDAHDRFEYFTSQKFDISECCQDLINKRPFGDHPFYIFAHARTDDDGSTKRLIWQPRLTKPKAQTNSMLFKAYPGSDVLKVIWMIPARELWDSFAKGKITENKTISESIWDFQNHREKLEQKEEDDLSDEQINKIYEEISREAANKIRNSSGSSPVF